MGNKKIGIKKIFYSKKLNIILYLLFIFGVLSYFFKGQIGSLIWRIKCNSPVIWNDIRIKFPKEIVYRKYNDSIIFLQWEDPKESVCLSKKDLKLITKEKLLHFFQGKNYQILDTADLNLNGYKGFMISYLDNKSKLYYKRIYVVPKNLYIFYEGEREESEFFYLILKNLEFL